jgi:hypothetical protein
VKLSFPNRYYSLAAETRSYATAAGRAQSVWRWRLRGGVFASFLLHQVYLQLGFIHSIDRITGVTILPHAETGKERSEMTIPYEGSGVGDDGGESDCLPPVDRSRTRWSRLAGKCLPT